MRRYLTLFLGFVLAAALLAFAAQAKTTRPSTTTVSLSGWSAGADEDALLRQVIKKFEQTHPSIKVDYSVINGDYPTAMTARFAAHNPPDVFYVDSALASTWADQGVLQPLNSYIAESKYDTAKFFPSLLGAFKVGKQIYGFPKDWSPLAMEINTGMLGAAKQKVPKTWADLQSVAQKLASSNAVPGGKPICLSPDWARLLAFVYQSGGSLSERAVGRRDEGRELLRRPAQERSRRDAGQARLGLVRRGARQGPDRDHLRGQLAAAVHARHVPEDPLRRLPDGRRTRPAATSRSPSRTRWPRTRRTRTPPGRCSRG